MGITETALAHYGPGHASTAYCGVSKTALDLTYAGNIHWCKECEDEEKRWKLRELIEGTE
jgi:hypothetical protein